jgi:hypothetical protein
VIEVGLGVVLTDGEGVALALAAGDALAPAEGDVPGLAAADAAGLVPGEVPGAALGEAATTGPAAVGFLFANSASVNFIASLIGIRATPLFLSTHPYVVKAVKFSFCAS